MLCLVIENLEPQQEDLELTNGLSGGPYKHVDLLNGTQAPFYIIPFDKKGRCKGPAARRHLVEAARTGGFTDVFLFSHGWNNDWAVATKRYDDLEELHQGVQPRQGRSTRLRRVPDLGPDPCGIQVP